MMQIYKTIEKTKINLFDNKALYPQISKDGDVEHEDFCKYKRHYFVFTEAGKPIYTRIGTENAISPLFATFAAIIPKILTFRIESQIDPLNAIQVVESENAKFVVLLKGNIFFIGTTKEP